MPQPTGKKQFQTATTSVLSVELRQVDHMTTREVTLLGSLLAASLIVIKNVDHRLFLQLIFLK